MPHRLNRLAVVPRDEKCFERPRPERPAEPYDGPAESGPTAGAAPSLAGQLIAFTAHRPDQVEAELRPQAPDAHVDDIRARIEVVAPHAGQQLPLRDGLAGVFGQLPQQQELQPGQRDRPGRDVGDKRPTSRARLRARTISPARSCPFSAVPPRSLTLTRASSSASENGLVR